MGRLADGTCRGPLFPGRNATSYIRIGIRSAQSRQRVATASDQALRWEQVLLLQVVAGLLRALPLGCTARSARLSAIILVAENLIFSANRLKVVKSAL
jgi:hypothetical protein